VFVILHLLLYPASNGFNSYHDRDTGPVGGQQLLQPEGRHTRLEGAYHFRLRPKKALHFCRASSFCFRVLGQRPI
jgi:hypothetical protein